MSKEQLAGKALAAKFREEYKTPKAKKMLAGKALAKKLREEEKKDGKKEQ